MFDMKQFSSAIQQIAEEKGISEEEVIATIEMALAAAYKRDYAEKGQNIQVQFNKDTGDIKVFQAKEVVTEDMLKPESEEGGEAEETKDDAAEKQKGAPEKEDGVEKGDAVEGEENKIRFNEDRHILLKDAEKEVKNKKAKLEPGIKKAKPEAHILYPLKPHSEFGRIAAQTAKQVIIQRIREAERESVFDEYKEKEGEIVSGVIQRVEGDSVYVDLGRATGVLSRSEQIPGEYYQIGRRVRAYVLSVEKDARGPTILLSRSYPKMVSRLFDLEVPEISAGTCEIRSIAREAGSRTKIAVMSHDERVDPTGSCVGQKGTRVTAVINELNGEKIDIIEWSEDAKEFVAHALAPANVTEVKLDKKNHAVVKVPADQLSLAIGKEGQNVRLAAKLTGWKIDIVTAEGKKESSATPEGEVEGGEKGENKKLRKKEDKEDKVSDKANKKKNKKVKSEE